MGNEPDCRATGQEYVPDDISYTCTVCDSRWIPKKKGNKPQRCPRCKSRMWDRSYRHGCSKCGYAWISSNFNPDRCPNCQSRKWFDSDGSVEIRTVPEISFTSKPAILRRYDSGLGCVKISLELGITFDEVYEVVRNTLHDGNVRL